MGMTLAGNPLHEDDTALTFAGLLGEVIRAWREWHWHGAGPTTS
jgi:hypothetical protein